MNDFERNLQDALSRREPPDGFANRVMARVPPARGRKVLPFPSHSLRWMSAAAALLITIGGAGSYEYLHARKQRQQAEQARRELIYALEITNAKLTMTFARLSAGKGGGI